MKLGPLFPISDIYFILTHCISVALSLSIQGRRCGYQEVMSLSMERIITLQEGTTSTIKVIQPPTLQLVTPFSSIIKGSRHYG